MSPLDVLDHEYFEWMLLVAAYRVIGRDREEAAEQARAKSRSR